ncbi:neuronal acetylcholine receptor subunit alpha-7-like isoform X3 [Portunus trituberculatus]|uniref:neuronal acetylcholine receptor subunit alpha-7-like isoform X3 n=1 Tax=Portunus trituberculatus TaxID=210409 RepID=UPI001E1D141F|nr:neuronal acetylcholine receptor subunit alpha-7-like isoform X3 [Portunus trituberculatus]
MWLTLWRTFGIVFFVAILPGCLPGHHERRLLNDLLKDYNKLERPTQNESSAIVVKLGLTLQQIINVDEKNQILTTNVWLNFEWTDHNLIWNETEYGGVTDLRINPKYLWTPDVLMYNSADEGFSSTYPTNVVVASSGLCTHIPPGIFFSTCRIDITWYPFDDQKCKMKFGSWTYDSAKIDLQLNNEQGGDISGYITNGEWDLIAVPGKRNTLTYTCCPEVYVDVTFQIHIRRRTLYYFSNLIMPCVLISSMALLGFTLPPDSGEKLTLGVTILLSLTVFLNIVTENIPETSDAVPLISTYFNCIMFMVASSVVLTVVVLNYHHRTPNSHAMPNWIRCVLLQWLPWILRMERPGKKITRKTIMMTNKMRELELKERSSKSLLANVLDIDDDIRQIQAMGSGTPSHNGGYPRLVGRSYEEGGPIVTPHTSFCFNKTRELQNILRELRYITNKMRCDEEVHEIEVDWKFAAMVVDRFCLITFTTYTIVSTIVVMLSAPHIIS